MAPVASIATASVTDARSWPRRRVRRWKADPTRPPGSGSSIAVTSSPGCEGGHAGAHEEVVERDHAARRPARAHAPRRVVDQQRRRRVGRRRRVADVAGQRRAVADLDRSDEARRLDQRRERAPASPAESWMSVITVPAEMRTRPATSRDRRRQLRDALDVDHHGRRVRAVAQADDQVRAAGQHARVAHRARPSSAIGVGQGRGSLVREGTHRRLRGPSRPRPCSTCGLAARTK